MLYVCGFCNENATSAVGEYGRRFQRRRILSRLRYSLHRQLLERRMFQCFIDILICCEANMMTKTLVEWCNAVLESVSDELLPALMLIHKLW
jgi:hypothetical protein